MPFTFLFKKKSTFSFLFSKYYLLENYQWRFVFLIQTDIEWKHGGQLWWVSRTVGAVALWSLPPAVVPTRVGGNPSSKQALLMTWKKLRVDILFENIAYFRRIINQIDINRWRVIIRYKMFIHVLRHIHVYSWIKYGYLQVLCWFVCCRWSCFVRFTLYRSGSASFTEGETW